jgi:hypothetical protein
MATLLSEYYLNVGSCALVIIEVEWAANFFDMPLGGCDRKLTIDLHTKRLRAELLRQILQGARKNDRLPVPVDLVRWSEHQASLFIIAKTYSV